MTTTEIRDRLTIVRRRQEQLMRHPVDDNTDELLDQLTMIECELEDMELVERTLDIPLDAHSQFVDDFLDWLADTPVVIEPAPYAEEENSNE